MGLNWSKGLIAAGSGLKEYSAIKAKEEYLAAATATATAKDVMGGYETLYKGVNDEINSINSRNQMGGAVDPTLQPRLDDLYKYQGILAKAIRTRNPIPDEILAQLTSTSGDTTPDEVIEDDAESWLSKVWSDIGPVSKKGWEFLKEYYYESWDKDDIEMPLTISSEEKERITRWAKTNWDKIKDKIKSNLNETNSGEGAQTPGGFIGEDLSSTSQNPQGLISEGEIAADELAALDQRFSAGGISDPGSTAQAGIGMSEEGLTQLIKENTIQQDEGVQQAEQLNKFIGSEEAISSLGAIGGPVAEPAGESTIVEFIIGNPSSKIKVSSPEVEEKKSISISNALGAIRNVESNVNGYNAVKGSKSGDRGLTTSTVGEAVKKHKNKAIGVGQFKYKEFMVPTAKKWFGMTEAQLKKQILTPQFQDALVIAGLYDAGLEQYAEGSINLDQFQKRIANIWRGLPPDKDTKKGDVTDKYGNIAGMSGEDLQNRMQKGLLSN